MGGGTMKRGGDEGGGATPIQHDNASTCRGEQKVERQGLEEEGKEGWEESGVKEGGTRTRRGD